MSQQGADHSPSETSLPHIVQIAATNPNQPSPLNILLDRPAQGSQETVLSV